MRVEINDTQTCVIVLFCYITSQVVLSMDVQTTGVFVSKTMIVAEQL